MRAPIQTREDRMAKVDRYFRWAGYAAAILMILAIIWLVSWPIMQRDYKYLKDHYGSSK